MRAPVSQKAELDSLTDAELASVTLPPAGLVGETLRDAFGRMIGRGCSLQWIAHLTEVEKDNVASLNLPIKDIPGAQLVLAIPKGFYDGCTRLDTEMDAPLEQPIQADTLSMLTAGISERIQVEAERSLVDYAQRVNDVLREFHKPPAFQPDGALTLQDLVKADHSADESSAMRPEDMLNADLRDVEVLSRFKAGVDRASGIMLGNMRKLHDQFGGKSIDTLRLDLSNDEYTELAKRARSRHYFAVTHHSSAIDDGTGVKDQWSWVEIRAYGEETCAWLNAELSHIRHCALLGNLCVEMAFEELTEEDIKSLWDNPADVASWYAQGHHVSMSINVKYDSLEERKTVEAYSRPEKLEKLREMGANLHCSLGAIHGKGKEVL
jgi:hypothetical protein